MILLGFVLVHIYTWKDQNTIAGLIREAESVNHFEVARFVISSLAHTACVCASDQSPGLLY